MKPAFAVVLALLLGLMPVAWRQVERNEPEDLPPLRRDRPRDVGAVALVEADATPLKESRTRSTQWLVFVSTNCLPCMRSKNDFQPWLTASGWEVSEDRSAHVRLIDGLKSVDECTFWRVDHFPTFVLIQNGKELVRWNRYVSREEMARLYNAHAMYEMNGIVGAISIGSLKGQRENVVRLIDGARTLIGKEGSLTMRWSRRGNGTDMDELALGESVSLRLANPIEVTYSMEGNVLKCRFQPAPRARFRLGVPVEQPVAGVTVSMDEIVIELPRMVDLRIPIVP